MTVAEVIAQECSPATRAVWQAVQRQTERGLWLSGKEDLTGLTGMSWAVVNRHLLTLERLGALVRYGRVSDGGGMKSTTHLMLVADPDCIVEDQQ